MKRIIALFVLACIAVCSMTACSSKEATPPKEETKNIMDGATAYTDTKSDIYVECGKSEGLTLKFNPVTTHFIVENSNDGSVWYSNPQNSSEDEYASKLVQMRMMSSLEIEYTNIASKKRTAINTYTSSVRSGKYKVYTLENGVVFEYDVAEVGKILYLAIYLENGNLVSDFWYKDSDKVKDEIALSTISVLPYFVRGSMEDNGYLFIPDSSGATIDFSNVAYKGSAYKRNIYGYEPTYLTSDYYLDVEKNAVYLPVYGATVNGSSVMAVCEEGAEYGVLNAEACGQTCAYARAYASYGLLNSVEYNVGNYDTELFDNTGFLPEVIKTRYMFLSGDNANYSGMARAYRSYLVQNNGLDLKGTENGFYADVYASVIKKVSTLGIPHNTTVSLTSNKNLEAMIEKLQDCGIEDITVRYRMWNADEIEGNKISSAEEASGVSIKKLKNIKGATVYPAILNLQTYSSGGYFDKLINASKSITQLPFSWKSYSLSNLNATDTQEYKVSVEWFDENTPKLVNKLKSKKLDNIAFGDIGNKLYCDYKDDGYKRDKTLISMEKLLKKANNEFDSVMLDSANAYAAIFADTVYNAPIDNSGHDIFSRRVPFYTIAMSGIVDCVAPIYNSGNEDNTVLNTVSAGAGLCVGWMWENTTELMGTELKSLTNVNFEKTFDETIELYKKISNVYAGVENSRIYSHSYINDDVSVTEYENGVKLYVNFGKEKFVLDDGTSLEPEDFIAKGDK